MDVVWSKKSLLRNCTRYCYVFCCLQSSIKFAVSFYKLIILTNGMWPLLARKPIFASDETMAVAVCYTLLPRHKFLFFCVARWKFDVVIKRY